MELGGPALKKELHIPCHTDPVNHLLSMCNHNKRDIWCESLNGTTTYIENQIKQWINLCKLSLRRFDNSLLDLRPAVTVKCFTAIPVEPYMHYMSDKLQTKQIQSNYIHRDTGLQVRDKANECLWQHADLRTKIEEVLVRDYDYFSFC